jgi:hypothetical protein
MSQLKHKKFFKSIIFLLSNINRQSSIHIGGILNKQKLRNLRKIVTEKNVALDVGQSFFSKCLIILTKKN